MVENASKKNKAIEWDGECKEAFQRPKEMCTSNPILAHVIFEKPFKLHIHVCILGLEAILYQNQDEIDRVIGYASRALIKTA